MNSDAEKLLIITHGWMDSAKMNSDWLKDAVQNVRLLNLQGFVLYSLPEVEISGTHQNLKILSTAGYRVPIKFQKLGTAGYKVPRKFQTLGTAGYWVPRKF